MRIAEELRSTKVVIAERWAREVVEQHPSLAALPRASLVDHLPEFLNGLADWVDGNSEAADEAFKLLAEGHALQRLNAGIELDVLTSEYGTLRRTIAEEIARASGSDDLVSSIIVLNAGIDCAIFHAVQRYALGRDVIRERFIGILAHDLRDPLTAVSMSAHLLQGMRMPPAQRELIAKIQRGATRIERMIDDVLDFARTKLGEGIPLSLVREDLGTMLKAAVGEARAAHPTQQIDLATSGDLRGMWDPDRVRQALSNLLSNARHYGEGPTVVRAWEDEDRQRLFTSVSNRGPVIPANVIASIFDPFSRATTVQRRGLGLGLFIVQQIAVAHGGGCRVSSNEHEGTTFTIEWPRVPVDEMPDRDVPP